MSVDRAHEDRETGGKVISEIGPWAMVPAWVLGKGLSAAELAVYIALRSFADREGDAHPRARTIADRANVSVGTARNAIQELRRRGLLTTEELFRPDGSLRGLQYRLFDIDPSPGEEVQPRRKASSEPPTSGDVPPSIGDEDNTPPAPGDVGGPAPGDVGVSTTWCRQEEHTTEHTKGEHTKEHPLPLRDQLTAARTRAGEEEGDSPQPEEPNLDQVVARFARDRPDWKPSVIREALTAAVAQGLAVDLRQAAAALRELAEGVHGTTDSPRRLVAYADGDWWANVRKPPAPAPKRVDDGPRCGKSGHERHPAAGCALCAAEARGRADDWAVTPEPEAATRAAAFLAGRRR